MYIELDYFFFLGFNFDVKAIEIFNFYSSLVRGEVQITKSLENIGPENCSAVKVVCSLNIWDPWYRVLEKNPKKVTFNHSRLKKPKKKLIFNKCKYSLS